MSSELAWLLNKDSSKDDITQKKCLEPSFWEANEIISYCNNIAYLLAEFEVWEKQIS